MHLLLLIVSHGPISFIWCTANVPGWAHWHMQRPLPIISHGPINFYTVHRQCTGMGPLEYVEFSADDFAWAHYFSYGVLGWAHWHMQRLLPIILHGPTIFYMVHCRCIRMGPLEYVESSANDFAWAHYFLHGALPMHSDGPIRICRIFC
jgi:hypothetical protein